MANVDTIWNKILIDERTQGEKIGIEKERKKIIAVLLKRGDTVEYISEFLEIPLNDVKTAKKELGI